MDVGKVAIDTELVPGVAVPKIPGLPGPTTPGTRTVFGPPAPDSVAGRLDMLTVRTAQRLRTPEGNAWAEHMAHEGHLQLWVDFAERMRGGMGRKQGWLGTALIAASMAANGIATYAAKREFARPRPFQADPNIIPIGPVPKSWSYPSGHTSSAFAAARTIARIEPKLANEAYDLARQVAISRVYAGVHYPSDVVAGALLGTGIAEALLRSTGRAVA